MINKNIIIRKAKLSDCDAVYNFGKSDELKNPNGEAPKRWWIEAFVKEKQYFYIAEDSKAKLMVGFILAERTTGDVMLIQEVFVRAEYRSKGIGDKLIKTVEKEARKIKIKAILLYAYAENSKTLKFYKKEKYAPGSLDEEFVKFLK
jgi:ribosomal protein S18 acetylase RimI-like enzyme